ncbi:MAG: PaaI family thioesterase [Ruminiclostridium sp.]|nr:PaaI family thioesterase [Ruminiclostridium sp.]
MRTLNEVREFFANDRFATDNGAVIEQIGENSATVSMEIQDHHRNAVGIVMGGAIFTLADFAFAVASNHEKPGTVSLSANITFLKASKGNKLIAKAECVRNGRTTCYYRVTVTDDTGALIAEVTTSGYKTN